MSEAVAARNDFSFIDMGGVQINWSAFSVAVLGETYLVAE